ncbi:MAG: deoxyuridine 5'-triphosphate nucleotidohydrolase, partial [Anaerorhabdus sp.]
MNKVAKFEKVSFEQFKEDWLKLFQDSEEKVREIYDGIILPKRATLGSAGYDFYIPIDMKFEPLEKKRIPT